MHYDNFRMLAAGRYDSLELSTQLVIIEAELRGHRVEVLDSHDNFIRITGNGKIEYLKQATRTSADSYIAPLIMENKHLTKRILAENGIRVPTGEIFVNEEEAASRYRHWSGTSCVIKPNSTNFGTAVSMLAARSTFAQYTEALRAAFAADSSVIAEELIEGEEYRFLVIGGKTRAVLHRIPANVRGDGQHTIAELVTEKNESPLRGKKYVTPLEKIHLDEEEIAYLASQGLSSSSVPDQCRIVNLRKNSNISTGGDSIDFTDKMHISYKEIAAAAAASVGAAVCGVDMIVRDKMTAARDDSYAVIELNFNPALHIHDFPHEGNNREVEKHLLDLLEL